MVVPSVAPSVAPPFGLRAACRRFSPPRVRRANSPLPRKRTQRLASARRIPRFRPALLRKAKAASSRRTIRALSRCERKNVRTRRLAGKSPVRRLAGNSGAGDPACGSLFRRLAGKVAQATPPAGVCSGDSPEHRASRPLRRGRRVAGPTPAVAIPPPLCPGRREMSAEVSKARRRSGVYSIVDFRFPPALQLPIFRRPCGF